MAKAGPRNLFTKNFFECSVGEHSKVYDCPSEQWKGGERMSPTERQQQLLELLCRRKHDTCENLAREFKVSIRTIYRDIEQLMCSYPIETVCGRYGGGVKVPDGYFICRHESLTPKQADLLVEMSTQFEGDKLDTLHSILTDFAP